MLLAADPNPFHLGGTRLGCLERGLDGGSGRFAPGFRVLLLGPGRESADEPVSALGAAEHLAVFCVHHQ